MLFVAITVALIARSAAQTPQQCFPGLEKMTACFGQMPPAPVPLTDSYTAGGRTAFDGLQFIASKIMLNLTMFCQHREHWQMALSCVDTEMALQCSGIPQEMRLKTDKMSTAFGNLCGRVNDINTTCLVTNSPVTMRCRNDATMALKTGDGMNMKMGPPPHGNMAMSMDMNSNMMEEDVCFFKFLMTTCIQKNITACHPITADAMVNVLKDMTSSPGCVKNMDTWRTASLAGNCVGPNCSGAVGVGPSAWLVLTLSALLGRAWLVSAAV